ncbi:hypothetical protein JCM11251_001979 [Rhodosporidiobolus azoricus]
MPFFPSYDRTLVVPPLKFSFAHLLNSLLLAVVSTSSISPHWTIYAFLLSHIISLGASSYIASGRKGVYLCPREEDLILIDEGGGTQWRSWRIPALEVLAITLRVVGARLNAGKPWVWMVVELYTPLFVFWLTPADRLSSSFATQPRALTRFASLVFFASLSGLSMLTTPDINAMGVIMSLYAAAAEAYRQRDIGRVVDDLEQAEARKVESTRTHEEIGATVLWATSLRAAMLQGTMWIASIHLHHDWLSPPSSPSRFSFAVLALVLLVPAHICGTVGLHALISDPINKRVSTFFPSSFAFSTSIALFILVIAMFGPSDERQGTVLMPLFTNCLVGDSPYLLFARRQETSAASTTDEGGDEEVGLASSDKSLLETTPTLSTPQLPTPVSLNTMETIRLLALAPVLVPFVWIGYVLVFFMK